MYKKDRVLSFWTTWYISYCLDYKLFDEIPPIDLVRKKIFEGIKSTKSLVEVYSAIVHASILGGSSSEMESMKKELLFLFKRKYVPEDESLIEWFEESLLGCRSITKETRYSKSSHYQ